MAKPSVKSYKMNKALDGITKSLFGGKTRTEAITSDTCVSCESDCSPESFADDLSKVEYGISGLCQKCQDQVFGVAP